MTLELDEIDDRSKPDFRRANGAPQVIDREGKNQRYGRPSNYAKPLDDESALTNWRIDTACMGVASHRDLQARWVAVDPDDRASRKQLREDSTQAGRGSEGADTGTAIHTMTDRWEADPTWEPPEPYLTQLRAYSAEMDRLGLRTLHVEAHIVNDTYRVAGTTDRIYELTLPLVTPHGEILPPGTLVIGDTKTTRRIEYSYPGYATQLALYAGGSFYDVAADQYLPTPEINQAWALIMYIPSDGTTCEAQWVDLEVGRWGAYLAQQVKGWQRQWRSGEYNCPRAVSPTAPAEEESWVDQMRPWVAERVKQIGAHEGARKYLTTWWPAGVLAPSKVVDVEHMTQILDLLDKTEAQFSLPFVTGRPATGGGPARSLHITNTPPAEEATS